MKQDEENDKELSILAKNSAHVKELEIQISQLKSDIKRLDQEKAAYSKKYKDTTTKIGQFESKLTGLKRSWRRRITGSPIFSTSSKEATEPSIRPKLN